MWKYFLIVKETKSQSHVFCCFAVQAKRGTSIVCLKLAAATKLLYFSHSNVYKTLSIKQPTKCKLTWVLFYNLAGLKAFTYSQHVIIRHCFKYMNSTCTVKPVLSKPYLNLCNYRSLTLSWLRRLSSLVQYGSWYIFWRNMLEFSSCYIFLSLKIVFVFANIAYPYQM